MKKYLYFTRPGMTNNADLIMIPADHILGASLQSGGDQTLNLTVTGIWYRPLDGTGTVPDYVNVIHEIGDRQKVLKSLVSLINNNKTNSPFIVASDDQNAEYAIEGVTGTRDIIHPA